MQRSYSRAHKGSSEKELYPEAISKLMKGFYVGQLARIKAAQHIPPFAFQHFGTDRKCSNLAVLLSRDTAFFPTTGPTVVHLKLLLSAVIAS